MPITLKVLVKILKENHLQEEVLYIELLKQIYVISNITRDEVFYISDKLKKLSKWRRLTSACYSMMQEANNGMDIDHAMSTLSKTHSDLMIEESGMERGEWGEDIEKRAKELIERRKNPNKFRGISVGISEFDEYTGGIKKQELMVIIFPTGKGKCHGAGTEILMYDGSIKKVEDIKVGDNLMGPDSKPRKVLSLATGIDQLYTVYQNNGNSYTVNKEHILCLKNTKTDLNKYETIYDEISVFDYINKDKYYKHLYKGYKISVNFRKRKLKLPPYFLGLWLGDGTSENQSISNNDNEIKEYLSQIANKIKYKFKARKDRTCYNLSINNKQGKNNVIRDALKYYNLINNKHIPKEFLINSKEKRLYLLAGLIDSDGYHAKSGICQIVSINKKWQMALHFYVDP